MIRTNAGIKAIDRVGRLVASRCRAAGLESEEVDEVYGRVMVGITPKLTEWPDDPDQILRYASGIVKNVISDVIGDLMKQRLHVEITNDEREDGELVADATAPTEDALIDRIDRDRLIEAGGGLAAMKAEHEKKVGRNRKRAQRAQRSVVEVDFAAPRGLIRGAA